ncbi:MAG: aminoacyl-histidine dipeptidase [Sphaerochaeta sp.]
MNNYSELEPKALFSFFKDISDIPRESGNEEGVRQYLINYANKNGYKSVVDHIGNVVIYVPATEGYENVPPVALQGHMDMVCVKTLESNHDFEKDPIELVVDGDLLHAKDTTLGGDNGIALAMILDVFSDKNCKHGPLEGLFTISEETGLTGAFNVEPELIKSKKLINLDSEEEGILYIGCAGGIETQATLTGEKEDISDNSYCYTLEVKDLMGGHSGAEIDQQRANAIKIAARALNNLKTIRLIEAVGGTKRNVIPSDCKMTFAIDKEEYKKLSSVVNDIEKVLANEYGVQEPNAKVILDRIDNGTKAFENHTSKALLRSLHMAPHGVDAMSMSLKGVVETSSNLAIIRTLENGFECISSHRSSIMSSRDDVAKRCGEVFETCGAEVKQVGAYPSWQPNMDSELKDFCAEAYEAYAGKKPLITAIHAGLECGIINSRIEGMDSISFGPDMGDVHSVKEHLSVSSVKRTSEFLKHVLSIIK